MIPTWVVLTIVVSAFAAFLAAWLLTALDIL